MESLPGAATIKFPDQPFSLLRRSFPHLSDEGIDLLRGLLTYDPSKRITARQALRHPWFEV
jgi:serine/threonine protein kinase